MRKHKITAALVAAAMAGLCGARATPASTIAKWTFESDTVATNDTPSADSGTGSADAIGMTNSYNSTTSVNTDDVLVGVTSGKKSDTGANSEADGTNEWRVRGQPGGTNGNGWSTQAPVGTQGAQFAASTLGFTGVNVSFDWYVTSSGEANLQLEYTDNGTTWTNVPITIGTNSSEGLAVVSNSSGTDANSVKGSYISDNALTNGSLAGQDWFQGLTATISDPLAANNPLFEIEMVNASTGASDIGTNGSAYNNSSGNWRFDNVTISGTAVPEPAALSLVGLAGLALLKRRRQAAETK
jgi:hypothetical protein